MHFQYPAFVLPSSHNCWFWYHICMQIIFTIYFMLPLQVSFSIFNFLVSNTVSLLHVTLQVAKFQRWNMHLFPARNKSLCHQYRVWVKFQLVLHILLMMILQLYHLPPPFPLPVSNSSCLYPRCQPLYVSCCTVLLYFSWYCTVGLKMFSLFFCVCKPITVQYYIAISVSWVPKLTLLDLWTNWT